MCYISKSKIKIIELQAVNLNAKDTLSINAKNNLDITSVNDSKYTDLQSKKKKSFGRSKTARNMSYKETVIGSTLNAKNISLNSNNKDINLMGAKLNAKDNLIATASNGDINILAAQYKEANLLSCPTVQTKITHKF